MKKRNIYIVPSNLDKSLARQQAKLLNIPEIVWGIPPSLKSEVSDTELPTVYEEILPEETPDPIEQLRELVDKLQKDVKDLKEKVK